MKKNHLNVWRWRTGGFTLIELLLVVVIIGILAAMVLPRFVGRTVEAQNAAATGQIATFVTMLAVYEQDNGRYPTTEQGLEALIHQPTTPPVPRKWKGPYLEKDVLPLDPWGNPYKFAFPSGNGKSYTLFSFGADGLEGTEDDIKK